MDIKSGCLDHHFSRTRLAYTWTRILNTPFWAIYTILPFIICKDLQATPWQIACIVSLKPIVSLFSFYWSSQIRSRGDLLVSNIIWATVLSHLPFLFVPWITNPWYFVFASAVYMLFHRGVNPAWMEVLKINIPENARKTVFAYGSAFYHVGGALLAILIGWILDDAFQAWRWIFPLTALFALLSIPFQLSIPVKSLNPDLMEKKASLASFNVKESFQKPWKDSWELIKKRPDFFRFQIGFMLGGGGLMLWQPALPHYFIETLQLNFKELAIAMTLCKSFGYAITLPLWTRAMSKVDIFTFSGIVTGIAALFPIGIMAAQLNLSWLYIAYFLYGMMQAGSELSWNLSGPIFSKHEDSSTYTGVNVATIGMRGCFAPPLGSLICNFTTAAFALLVGGGFCLLATWQMLRSRQQELQPFMIHSQSQ